LLGHGFRWTPNLYALPNQHLFVTVAIRVAPSNSRRNRPLIRSGIFNAIRNARPSFEPTFPAVRTDKVKKLGFAVS